MVVPPTTRRRSTTGCPQPTQPVERTLESISEPPLLSHSRRRQPSSPVEAIIAFLDSELEDPQNRTKACENLWDLEEGVHRSCLALEPPHLVVEVAGYGHMKLHRRRRHYSPPPHHFSDVVAGRDLLGFEEEEETNSTQQESHHLVAGVERYLRSKLQRRRRCYRRRPPPSVVAPPPNHHQIVELGDTVPTPPAPSSFVAGGAVHGRSKQQGSVWGCFGRR